jgi:hypothetical protein
LAISQLIQRATLMVCVSSMAAALLPASLHAQQPTLLGGSGEASKNPGRPESVCAPSLMDSAFIPVDSWVYPAVWRLYALGFVDTVFLNLRPYTRASLDHILEEAGAHIADADPSPAADEAQDIYESLTHELHYDMTGPCGAHQGHSRVESVYSAERGISGTALRDSFHLGSTIVNDYGRPYENGFNDYSGASGYASAGRFLLYVRGELQGAPSNQGYYSGLPLVLSHRVDQTNYFFNPTCYAVGSGPTCVPIPFNLLSTVPIGPIASATDGRIMEAYVSAHFLNHEISIGKQDDWMGPAQGGSFAYSNNAENIYAFHINRVEPLHIPLLSYLTGPFRYEFLVGSLKGHVYPNDPWVHVEKVSFRPTENLEFGFERTVIWGGHNHEPVNLHTFLRSFFSTANVTSAIKDSTRDPGARFGAFDFSYRLPFVRNWLTLYSDSEVHDDISPIDAPRRAAWRPGIYLSHVPGVPKLDVRVEGVSTDPPVYHSVGGFFMYWESVQRQGYTNKGQLFGDWIGRDDKGGQGWITYHLSGNEWLQVGVRNQKADADFIAGGTTLNDINFQAVKRIGKEFELNGNFAVERWKAPIYYTGTPTYPATLHSVTATTIQLTWFPKNKLVF